MSATGWLKSRSRSPEYARLRRRGLVLQGWVRDWLLEDRCLLANGPFDLPSPNTANDTSCVLYNSVVNPYQKTITITNNSPTQWIYPFLEGELTYQAQNQYAGTSGFDPYDPSTQEYRAYVGYFADDSENKPHNYAGLPPLASITIFVPLAFWDSGRFVVSTDGADQFSTFGGPSGGSPVGAPFNYLATNTQAIYYGSIKAGSLNQLDFTPVYNSFSGGMPSTSQWKSPVASGLFKDGQVFNVTGAGLPSGGEKVTIDSGHPNAITLPSPGTATPPAQQYVFTALAGQSISPTAHYIQPGFRFTAKPGAPATDTGLVMWYHALNVSAPNNDAPFQLNELSFRGTFYDSAINTGTGFQYLLPATVYEGAKTNSADYDLSFVDSINMPVAIEATDATIPNTATQLPFGWVGSGQSVEAFQAAVQAFSSPNSATNNNYLGDYFGGKGYPTYLAINPANPKLPAGQNLFLASPAVPGGVADIQYYKVFSDGSKIQSPLYALTSAGTGPSSLPLGGDSTHPSHGPFLGLYTGNLANQYALNTLMAPNIADGLKYAVTYKIGNTTYSAGNVIGFYYAADNKTIIGVKLDQDVPPNASSLVYSFALPQQDYAAGGIAGLWYSWAKYYADEVASSPNKKVAGTLTTGSNILTLAAPASGLVPGMAVTAASGTPTPPGTVILSISTDRRTIELSTAATGAATSFDFAAPSFASIVGYDMNGSPAGNTPHVDLSFPAAEQPYAMAFAQTVFTVMSAWSVSVPSSTPNGWALLMTNIIGGNLGPNILPHVNTDIANALTDMSKSLLRGVPDFTSPLYSNPAQWYPDPALPAGGQKYNVFNLDPYVWFIHDKLGLTAYAFALDDEIGNVNAGGATNVNFSIGGLNGLPNKDPYTNTSNFGVLTTGASTTPAKSSVIAGLTNPKVVYQAFPYAYDKLTPGTLVNGPGVPTGTTVQFTNIVGDNLPQSDIVLSNPLTSASTGPYSLFGAFTFTGTVLGIGQANDTIVLYNPAGASLNTPDVYDTLSKLGPLQNVQVTGEGIDPTQIVTIEKLTKSPAGLITIQLSANLHPALVSQKGSFYAYTFGSPQIGVIHDPGFEWRDVSKNLGQFNHGTQLSAITPDWTFTDSLTNAAWFAGIAYSNTSTYTKGSTTPLQGLQVGFVQGDSSISQKVTLGDGAYSLSLLAAQRATSQSPQSLSILVDGVPVGTIEPTDTTYKPYSVRFTVAGGKHTITLRGTQVADSTVLFDSVACTPAAKTLFASALPPLLDAIPDQRVNEGSTDSFTAVATSSILTPTFSLAPGAPAGAKINPVTGLFTWTPTAAGVYSVTVDVTGNTSPPVVDAESFTITVSRAVTYAVAVSNLAAPVYGQSLFFGAAVAGVPVLGTPTGTVQFVLDGFNFGTPVTLVNGAALSPSLATLGAGVHREAAIYSGDANYAAVVTPILTTIIARAPLTVFADNATRAYGQPNPLLTASYVGFVNGDTPASLTTPIVLWTAANPLSPVGTYAIAAWGASSSNYAITILAGALEVTPPPVGATPITREWTAFVTTLYEEVLGRNPDADGLAFWVRMLNRRVPPPTVALAFWNSPEHALLVAAGRAPQIDLTRAFQDAQTAGQVAF